MTHRTEIDRAAAVAELWPVDGPYRPEDLADPLEAVQHLLRYANHATLNAAARAVPDPEAAAILARRLGDSLGALPQLCQQLATRAERFAADPELRAASGAPQPGEVAAYTAAEALTELAAAADGLRRLAHEAASPLNTLYLESDPS